MSERLTVLVSHDMAHLNELIARGIIVAGFDLNNP
jgi:hypothetical protein